MKQRILLFFLIVFAVLLLAACAGTFAIESGSATAPPLEMVFAEGMPLYVTLATDDSLSGFGDYLDLSTLEEGDLRVLFASNMRLMNFRVIEVGYDDGFYLSSEVIVQKELLPDRPIVASWPTQGDMSLRGVSFVGEDYETRYFVLETAGDGFLLIEFK